MAGLGPRPATDGHELQESSARRVAGRGRPRPSRRQRCPDALRQASGAAELRFRGGIEVPYWAVTARRDLAKFGGPVHQGAGTGGLAGPADPRRKASLTRKRTLRKRLGAGGRAQSVGLFSVPLRFKYRDLQMVSRIRDRLDFAFLFADHQFPIVVKAPAHAHARFLIDPGRSA